MDAGALDAGAELELAAEADELEVLDELLDEHAAAARTTHTAPATTAAREARLGGALRKIITGRPYQGTSNKSTRRMPNCNGTDREMKEWLPLATMTTYQDVTREIAQDVASGELAA